MPIYQPTRTAVAASVAATALLAAILMHGLDAPVEGWNRPVDHLERLLHLAPAQAPEEPRRYADGPAAMVTSLDLGVPEYPRAIRTSSTRTQTVAHSTATSSYLSPDPPGRVLAFYQSKLGKEPGFVLEPQSDRILLSLAHPVSAGNSTGDFTLINIIPDPNHPGGTFLSIEHTPAPFPAIAPPPA